MPAALFWFLFGWNLHAGIVAAVDDRPIWATFMFAGAACAWWTARMLTKISRQERP